MVGGVALRPRLPAQQALYGWAIHQRTRTRRTPPSNHPSTLRWLRGHGRPGPGSSNPAPRASNRASTSICQRTPRRHCAGVPPGAGWLAFHPGPLAPSALSTINQPPSTSPNMYTSRRFASPFLKNNSRVDLGLSPLEFKLQPAPRVQRGSKLSDFDWSAFGFLGLLRHARPPDTPPVQAPVHRPFDKTKNRVTVRYSKRQPAEIGKMH
jgi:hypothetical protein